MNEEFEYDQAGIDLTVASEGLQLTAYPDPGSGGAPWTIGVGHTGPDVTEGMTITKDEAYDLLRKDIKSASDAVKRFVTVQLNKNQFDALTDFVFNVGLGNFASSTLLKKLNNGDYDGAGEQFAAWNKASGRVLQGLVTRRSNEENMFNS